MLASMERANQGLGVTVLWLLAAHREQGDEAVPFGHLVRELEANGGPGATVLLPGFAKSLDLLRRKGLFVAEGPPAEPVLRLARAGEDFLRDFDGELAATAAARGWGDGPANGVRGPYPSARMYVMAWLRELRGEGPRLTRH